MKRILSLLLFTFSLGISNAQIQYVPDSVYFVMEVDLGKVVKSISLEEIDKLEVTKSILSELNNTPENDIQLSDLGVDLNSKLIRSEEHTSELQSRPHLVCRLLLEKKKKKKKKQNI